MVKHQLALRQYVAALHELEPELDATKIVRRRMNKYKKSKYNTIYQFVRRVLMDSRKQRAKQTRTKTAQTKAKQTKTKQTKTK